MSYFLFTFEHMPVSKFTEIESKVNAVKSVWMENYHPDGMSLIHADSKEDAEKVQEIFWEFNGGMYCEFREITDEDELDSYS